MPNFSRYLCRFFIKALFASTAVASLLFSQPGFAQEVTLPSEIRQALENNGENFSPLTIEWKRNNHGDKTVEELVKKWGPDGLSLYQPGSGILCFQDSMFYSRFSLMLPHIVPKKNGGGFDYTGEFTEEIVGYSFDGRNLYNAMKNPLKTVCIYDDHKLNEDYQVLANQFPKTQQLFGFILLPDYPFSSSILYHLDNGGKLISITSETAESTDCTVLKLDVAALPDFSWADRQEVYYLDPRKNYAVVQIDWLTPEGRLICRTKNRDWEKFNGDLWVPKFSSREWHTSIICKGELFDDIFIFEDYSFDFTRKKHASCQFSPDLDEPGLSVVDTRSEAKSKPGAVWNEHIKGWAYTNPPDLPSLQSSKAKPFRIVLIVVAVVLIGLVIFLKIYRARKA